jgi:2,5-dihydroxypyridine 5,6-dioxygenase
VFGLSPEGPVDQNLFNEICLQQLTLSGVHEGETVAVLTRGAERG